MVANGGKAALHVDGRGSDPELALERVNRDARIGARPVSIVQPRDVAVHQLALAIIQVHEHREVGLRVDVYYFAAVNRPRLPPPPRPRPTHAAPPQLPP